MFQCLAQYLAHNGHLRPLNEYHVQGTHAQFREKKDYGLLQTRRTRILMEVWEQKENTRHGVRRIQNVIIWGITYTGMKNSQRNTNSLHYTVEALRKRAITLLANIVLSFQHVFDAKQIYFFFFYKISRIWYIFYNYSKSQFGLATFPVLKSHMSLVATILNSLGLQDAISTSKYLSKSIYTMTKNSRKWTMVGLLRIVI